MSGNLLPGGATLSIHTAAPIPLAQETPVAWNGSGQDFFLFPPEPAAGDLRLLIFHLGGYGVARGTDAERETQQGKQPIEDGDLLSHETSPLLREGRAEAAPSGLVRKAPDWRTRLKDRYNGEYLRILDRMRSAIDPTTVLDLDLEIDSWARRVTRNLGVVDQLWPGRGAEIKERLTDMFGRALDWIHERCSTATTQIFYLPYVTWAIHRDNIDLATKIDQTVGCLTFNLRFESELEAHAAIVTLHWVALAENVKLRSHLDPSGKLRAEGAASIAHTEVGMSTPVQQCTSTNEIGAPDVFKASMEWTNLDRRTRPALKRVVYDHGTPHSRLVLNCPFVPPTEYKDKWSEFYDSLHIADLNGPAEYPCSAREWIVTGERDPWATRAYTNGTPALNQDTQLKLTHTPE